ncbi:MAG: 4-hydroxy-3-methylbut-2-en-1-yl diphosphate synthase [Candidatus Moranbacteria bacterium GW2011_GWE2_35_2-]|nr:MAG: 4-hydroxy-3-methylbut-2-en-1-yl diphosphate synthase [Candidatus Moranbacteria bacterium GW2011_GWE2_35_2-]KKQ06621.1 MAG: 4-hydroxy-3-methylbut-2-en-1-yl diphosphate synthase [Candidatus Moranbacteria bacterium GW2011_GWF1_36_4]KKQ22783.1 MAG: 4-hydroxy-3-methylbut-2-en-1-yl diphosphate synthase [Candidatus Moranbacteria bacterium GW2011_GWF2_37_11]KKQ28794.1 MAG: 4-hydroxy-3-methylbut-2-en-1-yl diphosphate synthase [Candidatus Moranbacteria bacterium GW2011_GWD1_37_17]KKQ30986.1 MAG: 
MKKYQSRVVKVGNLKLGGDNPVRIQSMCNTDTRNIKDTVKQILALEKAGCEIIRVAVPDMAAAKAIGKIKKRIHIPLVADIHFDYKLALEAINQGIDKVRINPGNIGSEEKIKAVIDACKKKKIPIRIGVNSGSIEQDLLNKYGATPKAAVESAMRHVRILEKFNFKNILISIKFSNVPHMIQAYQILAKRVDYPLHLGVTEAGTVFKGSIKNAIGIGVLLNQGIGSTFRVSLTADPLEEMDTCWAILQSLELRRRGPEMISCPTCGRTEIDLIGLANKVEKALLKIKIPIKVAVMGCVVNGPGEAREADIGVAGGKGMGAIFAKGKVIKSVKEKDILPTLLEEIRKLEKEKI